MYHLRLGEAPAGASASASALSTQTHSPPKFTYPNPPLFSNRRHKFLSTTGSLPSTLKTIVVNAEAANKSKPTPTSTSTTSFTTDSQPISIVGQESVRLEGVIQFEKPNSYARLKKWGNVALLAGGDVLAILLFSAIGRFSHGFSVFDTETLHTADPFVAGWFLSAYFLGGYGDDGRVLNGKSTAITAAIKSWAVGIPLGIFIRAASLGHMPPIGFVVVTMGSTALLLIGWRALMSNILANEKSKKNEQYKRGSPFELFELLTSLVRRW